MTVFNNIWQAYLTLQVSLILPLILIIAANVAVVASTMIEKKCQNIWDNKDKSKFQNLTSKNKYWAPSQKIHILMETVDYVWN